MAENTGSIAAGDAPEEKGKPDVQAIMAEIRQRVKAEIEKTSRNSDAI